MQRRRLNFAQRIAVIVGLGAGLYLIGSWLTSLDSFTGWVGYAPLQQNTATFETAPYLSGLHPWVRLVIWLVLIAVWVGVSLALLRSSSLHDASNEFPT
jgi:hypothetical protein